MKGTEKIQQPLRDLVNLMHYTEQLSSRIHGLFSEQDIFQAVAEEFKKLKPYDATVSLLTEDGKLVIKTASSITPDIQEAAEKKSGIKLSGFDLLRLEPFRRAISENHTVCTTSEEILEELFPKPLAAVIAVITGYKNRRTIISPLIKRRKVIGAIAINAPELVEHFIPSAQILCSHISTALELAEEMSDRQRIETELATSEEKFRSLLENLPCTVARVDTSGKFLFVNKYYRALSGLRLEEIIGHGPEVIKRFFDPVSYAVMVRDVTRALTEQTRIESELWGRDAQQKEICLLQSAYPWYVKEGILGGVEILAYNIIARKKAEQALQELNESLERRIIERTEELRKSQERLHHAEKMEAIGQLAGGIAHDFNNQLVGIMGGADLLKASLADNPSLYELADLIVHAAERSSQLTRQLLAFARKGKYQILPKSIHMVIEEVVSILERSTLKKIIIKQNLNSRLHTVQGDPTQLHTIFLNIALNARDAMPEGGELCFSTTDTEFDFSRCSQFPYELQPGKYLEVSITDTGIGMDPETKKRLFEPFFTTKEPGKGTGMGLAAVYGAVRTHNGAIEVQSSIGKGTTFTVYLPVTEYKHTEAVSRSTDSSQGKTGGHILLVDDEQIVNEALSRILTKQGYTVTVCRNGKEAVELYRTACKSVDLVILDLLMPEMNGHEAFLAMRQINPKIKVLLSTGFSPDDQTRKLIDEGAAGFIQKPYPVEELLRRITGILGG